MILPITHPVSKEYTMAKTALTCRLLMILLMCMISFGCVQIPNDILKPSADYLKKHTLQMKQYETKDEKNIISAVAGVLQDLGFELSDSEIEVGFVGAFKRSDATDPAQVMGACVVDILGAANGSYSNYSAKVDAYQYVKASVITKLSANGNATVVRVTFQRVVWNKSSQISRVETINDEVIYKKFFDSLSKSIFLEAHEI